MGALKQLSNNGTGEYLKVTNNCQIIGVPSSKYTDSEGMEQTVPPRVIFKIGYQVFENYAKRLESETNKWVKGELGNVDVNFIPILPAGWEPVNPANEEAEKLVAMAYLALLGLPEFAAWVTYQP
jgi:hypothetical protein